MRGSNHTQSLALFQNFVHFCSNFQIFCFKSHTCPQFLEQALSKNSRGEGCSIQLVCLASQTCLVGNYQGDAEKKCVEEEMHDRKEFSNNIVTRNRKIAWKHGPSWSFYTLMLRTKLYYSPFFITGHQNVNKPKSRAVRTVYGLIFLPFYKIIVSFFFFFMSRCKQNKIKLCYNRLQFVKETQTNTV